jgi:hypothetical protein
MELKEIAYKLTVCKVADISEIDMSVDFYLKLSGNTPTSTGSGMNRSCTA